MRRTWLMAPLAVALLAAACGGQNGGGSDRPTGNELRGHTFVSRAIFSDGEPYALGQDTRLTLRFADDGRLAAHVACNTVGGPADLSDGRIAVADAGITDMSCREPLEGQDRWMVALLDARPSWDLTGGTLVLGTSTYRVEMIDEDDLESGLPLLDTTWTLDSTITGETATHSEVMSTVTMSFTGSRVNGVSACGSFGGDAEVDESSVTFAGLVPGTPGIRACSDDEKAIERRVLGALTGRVTAAIHEDRLTLSTGSGEEFVWVGTR